MLRLEMLPAHHGDSLLIEYRSKDEVRRVLIDGGTPESFDAVDARLAKIGARVDLELLVVTHVDEDHIGGTLALLIHSQGRIAARDVWFNAYHHLFPPDVQGAAQGEGLSTAITRAGYDWNAAFSKREQSVVVPDAGDLPVVPLRDDAKLTLLSPTWPKLERLQKTWVDACKLAKLVPGKGAEPEDVLGKRDRPEGLDETSVREYAAVKYKQDPSRPNGSSIAFLFEFGGKTLLLTGDAHPDGVVPRSVELLG